MDKILGTLLNTKTQFVQKKHETNNLQNDHEVESKHFIKQLQQKLNIRTFDEGFTAELLY